MKLEKKRIESEDIWESTKKEKFTSESRFPEVNLHRMQVF